MDDSAAFG